MEAGLARLARQPGKRDLAVLLFYGWDKRAGPVGEISLERGEISLTGMKIFHINTHKRAGPVARMKDISKSCQKIVKTMSQLFCGMRKLQNCPGKRDEIFSYKHKPSHSENALNCSTFENTETTENFQ